MESHEVSFWITRARWARCQTPQARITRASVRSGAEMDPAYEARDFLISFQGSGLWGPLAFKDSDGFQVTRFSRSP